MAEQSKIQWTHSTFNPWRGCAKISPGCANCYAERMSLRNERVLGEWGPHGTRVLAADDMWEQPHKWQRSAKKKNQQVLVFCASLADVFEEWPGQVNNYLGVPLESGLPEARERLWNLIRQTPNLIWQILTKRPENIRRFMPAGNWPNVWLGVSVESQDYAWRIDVLSDTSESHQVPVRFLSYEPALGPLTLWQGIESLQWVIMGGESGEDSRTANTAWFYSLLAQCRWANVPAFIKQMGRQCEHQTFTEKRYPLHLASDRFKGGDPVDWPPGLNVRRFPTCFAPEFYLFS